MKSKLKYWRFDAFLTFFDATQFHSASWANDKLGWAFQASHANNFYIYATVILQNLYITYRPGSPQA